MTSQPGILAIWNDVKPGREADFETWFQSEHLAERLAVPGFQFGRRHEAISGAPRFFVFYVTDGPEVLTSEPYCDRVDNPTPMTRMIMSEVFLNMNRTVCRRVARRGPTWAAGSAGILHRAAAATRTCRSPGRCRGRPAPRTRR